MDELDLKYRIQSLEEVIGNSATVDGIKSAIAKKTHTYLLYGMRGCGKTSLARIIAKELGCHPNDVAEWNISKMRGIDTARDIIDSLNLAPLYGKAKCIILNEVHGGTKDFHNSMLEVLEETPEHVFFILCTTDPEKLLSTVVDRAASFKVKPLTQADTRVLLERVLKAENVEGLPEVLIKAIVEKSQGIPRNVLKLLDKIIDVTDDNEALELINDSIGIAEIKEVGVLIRALLDQKPFTDISLLLKNEKIKNEAPESIRMAILGYCTEVLLSNQGKYHSRAADLIAAFSENTYSSGRAGIVATCYFNSTPI
jgi:DNA polymerase III subunit gamma/tau